MLVLGGQPAAHECGHRPPDDSFAGVGAPFVVTDQAPTAQEPGKGSFHDPAAGQDLKAAYIVAAADDVEDESEVLGGPVLEVAAVAAVGPDQRESRKVAPRRGQQDAGGIPVGRGRRRDQHVQQESERVGEQVPLPSVDLFPGVVPP